MGMIPTVHLNGTSKDALIEQNTAALKALQSAIKALRMAAPHGRDFYVQKDGAFQEAVRLHHARLASLVAVEADLTALVSGIYRQG